MLSSTGEVADIKLKLTTLTEYGYETELEYNTAICNAINAAKLKYLLPCLDVDSYNEIAALDKTGLSTEQECIYWAEVCFSTAIFLQEIANKEQQQRAAESDSQSLKGKSKSSSGRIGKYGAGGFWFQEGLKYLKLAGYVPSHTISRDGIEVSWRILNESTIPSQSE